MSLLDLDRAALVAARTRGHGAVADRLVGAFSRTGEHAAIWFALGLSGAMTSTDPARGRLWRRGVRTVAGAYVVNYAVKLTVRRHRPRLDGLPPLTPTVSRLSFPSAHATSSFAAAWSYRAVVPALPLYAVAGAFAVSRPYLGVHYPTDVLAGALLGTAVGVAWPAVERLAAPRVAAGLAALRARRGRIGREVRA